MELGAGIGVRGGEGMMRAGADVGCDQKVGCRARTASCVGSILMECA
jgi:hypothetical protein